MVAVRCRSRLVLGCEFKIWEQGNGNQNCNVKAMANFSAEMGWDVMGSCDEYQHAE